MPRRHARQINLRLTEPLRRRLESAAKEREISINHLMRQLLEEGLENKPIQSLASFVADWEREMRDAIEHGARKEDIEPRLRCLAALGALLRGTYTQAEQLLLLYMPDPKVRELVRGAPQEREKGGKK